MTTKAQQIRVGIFILAGFVMTLVSLFYVGGQQFIKPHAVLHARFEQVLGLNEGSAVSLQGIRIGSIKRFHFLPQENKLDAVMEIDKEFLPRITEGSQVEIRTQGALGDKYILIIPGEATATALNDGATLEMRTANDLMTVFSEKGGQAGQVFDIIKDVRSMTKAMTDNDRMETIMKNMAEASVSLKQASADSKALIAEIRNDSAKKVNSSVDKLEKILSKIDRGEGTLGALINDSSLHESLKALLGGEGRKASLRSLMRQSLDSTGKAEK